MTDFVNDLLCDTDDDADDTDLPDLMRERFERLEYLKHTDRLASAGSRRGPRLPWSTSLAYTPLYHLPDESCQVSSSAALRVLVLEDDPPLQEVFSLLFAPEEGFDMECVSEVATCLEHLRATNPWSDSGRSNQRRPHRPFDVVLLDVCLQGGHLGTEVFAAAQQEPGLHLPPIVICTVLSDRALATVLKDSAVSLLADDVRVVHKPFDIDTLTTEVHSAARLRRPVLACTYIPGARAVALATATKGTP